MEHFYNFNIGFGNEEATHTYQPVIDTTEPEWLFGSVANSAPADAWTYNTSGLTGTMGISSTVSGQWPRVETTASTQATHGPTSGFEGFQHGSTYSPWFESDLRYLTSTAPTPDVASTVYASSSTNGNNFSMALDATTSQATVAYPQGPEEQAIQVMHRHVPGSYYLPSMLQPRDRATFGEASFYLADLPAGQTCYSPPTAPELQTQHLHEAGHPTQETTMHRPAMASPNYIITHANTSADNGPTLEISNALESRSQREEQGGPVLLDLTVKANISALGLDGKPRLLDLIGRYWRPLTPDEAAKVYAVLSLSRGTIIFNRVFESLSRSAQKKIRMCDDGGYVCGGRFKCPFCTGHEGWKEIRDRNDHINGHHLGITVNCYCGGTRVSCRGVYKGYHPLLSHLRDVEDPQRIVRRRAKNAKNAKKNAKTDAKSVKKNAKKNAKWPSILREE